MTAISNNKKYLAFVLLVLSADGGHAFAPMNPSTTTTARALASPTTSSSVPQAPSHYQRAVGHPPSSSSSGTALYMGSASNLVDRFLRVTKANVNKLVSSLENPEKVIVQAVEDMQTDLVKVRQTYAEATATQRRLTRQKQQIEAVADDWYARANLALKRDQEVLARQALARRQDLLQQAADLQSQLDTQSAATDKLHEAMMELERKIQEAARKKEQLVARAKTARSTQQVNDMLNGLPTGKTSMDAFRRMEEKVQALEVAAQVSSEMSLLSPSSSSGADYSLETEFLLLEASSEVDAELDRMKSELKLLEASPVKKKKVEVKEVVREDRVSIPVL